MKKEIKTLFIYPNSSAPNPLVPLGIAYIASYLRKFNKFVDVIDCWGLSLSLEQLKKKLLNLDYIPDIIGISSMTKNFNSAKNTIKMIKQNFPNTTLIMGGTHISALPKETLNEIPEIDIGCIGEGEKTMLSIVNAFENNENLLNIKGIIFKKENEYINTGQPEIISDLDDLPFPAIDLFPVQNYVGVPPYGIEKKYINMITSRGCPFHCVYCTKSVFGKKYRGQSPERIVKDILKLKDDFGIKAIHFYDDDFTMNMKRTEEFCNIIINEKINIKWSCTTRVDLVTYELLKKMKKAGCWLISYGVESAYNSTLKRMKKGFTIEKVKQAFKWTEKIGIKRLGFFLMGFPGQTKKEIIDTVNLSIFLNPTFISWGITNAFPGTELYNMVLSSNKNYEIKKTDYYYQGQKSKFYYCNDKISLEKLLELSKKANKAFYFRWNYLIQRFKEIKNINDLMYYIKGAYYLLFYRIFNKKK